jgi:hypothetical protein
MATSTKKKAAKKVKSAAVKKPAAVKKSAAKKVPAKKSARVVPKVSPLRGTSVDAFVAGLAPWQREIVAALRDIVTRAAPQINVAIKWAQPVFDLGGPVAYIKPASKHVTLGFWRGAELADPKGLLEGGDRMKNLKVSDAKAIDVAAVTAFVKEAARLNAAKGDPTRR